MRMRILFVIPYPPSLIRTRSYNMIRRLKENGHQISLLTLWSDEQERADIAGIAPYCDQVHALPMPAWRSYMNCAIALASRQPLQSVYSWQPKLVNQMNGDSPYDVIHVEHLRGAKYGLYLKKHTNISVVWDSVDCISHLFKQAAAKGSSPLKRLITKLELSRTERLEGQLPAFFDHVLITSKTDEQALINLTKNNLAAEKLSIIPNGVDLDHFHPVPHQSRDAGTLVISGKMSYHANEAMALYTAQEIMPLVWERQSNVKLQIVGKDPSGQIQALGSHPQIEVTGMVPEIRSYLQKATLALTPLTYGAGIQNKALEAMACGAPLVSSPIAIAGLKGVESEKQLIVGATPNEIAHHILSLLNNPNRRNELGVAGRKYVEKNYDWEHIITQVEDIYNEVHSQTC